MKENRAKKYVTFVQTPNPGKKTAIWAVITTLGEEVGKIRWWGAWRGYCFFPSSETLFDKDCLRLIADFVEQRNRTHSDMRRAMKDGDAYHFRGRTTGDRENGLKHEMMFIDESVE